MAEGGGEVAVYCDWGVAEGGRRWREGEEAERGEGWRLSVEAERTMENPKRAIREMRFFAPPSDSELGLSVVDRGEARGGEVRGVGAEMGVGMRGAVRSLSVGESMEGESEGMGEKSMMLRLGFGGKGGGMSASSCYAIN